MGFPALSSCPGASISPAPPLPRKTYIFSARITKRHKFSGLVVSTNFTPIRLHPFFELEGMETCTLIPPFNRHWGWHNGFTNIAQRYFYNTIRMPVLYWVEDRGDKITN